MGIAFFISPLVNCTMLFASFVFAPADRESRAFYLSVSMALPLFLIPCHSSFSCCTEPSPATNPRVNRQPSMRPTISCNLWAKMHHHHPFDTRAVVCHSRTMEQSKILNPAIGSLCLAGQTASKVSCGDGPRFRAGVCENR